MTLLASLELVDLNSGQVVDSEILEVVEDFVSHAYRVRGDRRALPDRIRRDSRHALLPFPLNEEMVASASVHLLSSYEKALKSLRYN